MDFATKFFVIAILTAVGILPVFSVLVEVEQGTLRGETVTFVEEKHANISAKIDVFKVSLKPFIKWWGLQSYGTPIYTHGRVCYDLPEKHN